MVRGSASSNGSDGTVLRPVPGAPVLELRSEGHPATLVIADLHLGLGASDRIVEGPPEASARGMARSLLDLADRTGARGLVIAGDVKHPILGTPRALGPVIFDFFSDLLRGGLAVDVVLGNHDVGLVRHLPREVGVHPASGTIVHGVGIFHGHRWPSNRLLGARTLVAGHLHPGFRLAAGPEEASGKHRCWVRVSFPIPAAKPRRRRRRHAPLRAREMIVLPAFNPISGTEALNRERPRRGRSFLFSRFLARGETRAYLLDGTDLGPIPTGKVGRPKRSPPRARPDR